MNCGQTPITSRQLVTISVPVLNEAENIDRLLVRLQAIAAADPDYDFEFLFTDNASTDDTFAKLAEWAARDERVRVLRFSRNFGFQPSILTNLLHARGAAAVQIDADLQDPPELISAFLAKWREGYKVVYGIRRHRRENRLLLSARRLHYRLIRFLSELDIPLDAGDFRLIDRDVIEKLREYEDRTPYLRGIIASIGYAQIGIPYDRLERVAGTSKFNFAKLLMLSFDGICSQSTKPLQYITLFGVGVSGIMMFMIVAYVFVFLLDAADLPRGFTTLTLLVLASIGLNAAFVGILGEYIGRIYATVRRGPTTIIADRIEGIAAPGRSTEHVEG